jgi:hypothetical protein
VERGVGRHDSVWRGRGRAASILPDPSIVADSCAHPRRPRIRRAETPWNRDPAVDTSGVAPRRALAGFAARRADRARSGWMRRA